MFRKFPRRRQTIGKFNIRLDGQHLNYTLKQGFRTRYIRLEIWPDEGLVVIVPRKYDIEYVNKFIESKQNWILTKLSQHDAVPEKRTPRELRHNDTIYFLGNKVAINVLNDANKKCDVSLEQDRLIINLNHRGKNIETLIENWYRFQAQLLINEKTEEYSRLMGLKYARFSIRGQRTRWGSCSRKGTLSFNWKLMKAPETIIDYVVIHELAHLKEMNHSAKFWGLVARYYPQYRQSRLWLRKNQELLASF